ncbi:hypothetical protein KIN20_020143 [Parelaphostrongylus tenuis]|uniref:Uncharacterized protein n=1 Tax=Parelaphostrongylus tenuis TaxID=148309 RepID=A0AAD5QQM0_PARTN|nr:hypothetical protein KIN20_020143 [Parelaphostrongylus tenuis]
MARRTVSTNILRSSKRKLEIEAAVEITIMSGNEYTTSLHHSAEDGYCLMHCNGWAVHGYDDNDFFSTSHTSIPGTITISNLIMELEQRKAASCVEQAVRMLTLSPFGSHFFSATGALN